MATAPTDRVTLRIGETEFFTTRATLAPSQFFQTLWTLNSPEQAEFFIDADPALFEHVLCYLRTRMFPLFYDPDKGHDKPLYIALLQQAKFFGIETLAMWISQEQYLEAVGRKTRAVSKTMCGDLQIQHFMETIANKGESIQVLSSRESMDKRWACPNSIWQHDGDRRSCFTARCSRAYSSDFSVEMRVLEVTLMLTSTNVREDLCLPVGPAPEEPLRYVTQ